MGLDYSNDPLELIRADGHGQYRCRRSFRLRRRRRADPPPPAVLLDGPVLLLHLQPLHRASALVRAGLALRDQALVAALDHLRPRLKTICRGHLELTRFGGHPMVGAERSVHDAEEPSAVPGGVPTAHHRTGAEGTDARRTGAPVRSLGPGDPELGSAGRP